jgi:heptosyltransferase-2
VQPPLTKILIIRFSSIGDIVLTSALVRCLKQQLHRTEVHFLTKAAFAPVLKANPHIAMVWEYDHNFNDLIPQLKSQEFDYVIDLHKNVRSSFVRSQLGVKSATFPKLNVQKWAVVRFKMNFLPDVHIVDRYFRAARHFNITNDGRGLDYFIPVGDEVTAEDLPASHRSGFIAIVIGGKHQTKIFPAGKVAEVCRMLGSPVILLGGREDRPRGEEIAEASGALVFNACGLFNINQSASLISQASAVLTNDTGLMHVAAAFKKPVVSVWGNTIPAFGMYPYLPEEDRSLSFIAEVEGLSCRPCSKLGFPECPKKHFRCMNDIDIAPIVVFLSRYKSEIVHRKS